MIIQILLNKTKIIYIKVNKCKKSLAEKKLKTLLEMLEN